MTSTPVALAFTVAGEPLPKARPQYRVGQPGAFTPPATRKAEARIADTFRSLYSGVAPLEGELGLRVEFYRVTRRPVDLDNLVKLVSDALNGVAWVDDRQIQWLTASRFYGAGKDARTEIRIFSID